MFDPHMKNLPLCAAIGFALALPLRALPAQEAATIPSGMVSISIPAGTGAVKKTSLISLPLLETAALDGKSVGRFTGVTSTTFSDTSADWTPGELSNVAEPKLLLITSGAAEGYIFLISTAATSQNTATSATISADDSVVADLTSLGIRTGESGDTYRILNCDTLASLFGTPETSGVLGGTSPTTADSIILVVNGITSTYYYKTDVTPNRWTKLAWGNPDASNTPVPPYYGIQYGRLGSTSIGLTVRGDIPSNPRKAFVKNSGTTFLAQFWPVDSTLGSTAISSLPGWFSGPSPNTADTVIITSNGVTSTFWFDGTNWRKLAFGSPISDTALIPVGSTLSLVKKGTVPGSSMLSQNLPYTLQ
ncbi:TIGR02597 family protein [Spartobacteria bacterium LR76]|nr:TIGR02597 family protein [Spartobacteria bacterium LR76]